MDYDYIKNHYRLIAVDLSRQKELDADPKAIQQIVFVRQLKNPDDAIVANGSMFVLTILEKMKETILKFSQGSITALKMLPNHEEARVKLTNTQLNKLKSAAKKKRKKKTGATLRITKKNFQDEELPHELFLTIRNKPKMRNAFTNNMWMVMKFSKAQFSKISQFNGFLGKTLGNLFKPRFFCNLCWQKKFRCKIGFSQFSPAKC